MAKVKAKGSIVLEILIVILTAILIYTIYDPAMKIRAEEEMKKDCRIRMKNIRQAELIYYDEYEKYLGDLDSLISYIKHRNIPDTLFFASTYRFNPDSLRHCPRTGERYILETDSLMRSYYLECTYGHGYVGARGKPEDVNKLSWE